jgi:hypothetical protein
MAVVMRCRSVSTSSISEWRVQCRASSRRSSVARREWMVPAASSAAVPMAVASIGSPVAIVRLASLVWEIARERT